MEWHNSDSILSSHASSLSRFCFSFGIVDYVCADNCFSFASSTGDYNYLKFILVFLLLLFSSHRLDCAKLIVFRSFGHRVGHNIPNNIHNDKSTNNINSIPMRIFFLYTRNKTKGGYYFDILKYSLMFCMKTKIGFSLHLNSVSQSVFFPFLVFVCIQ